MIPIKDSLRYFRNAPFPIKQPKNANRRTDAGENLLSIQFASYLREMTLTDRCSCVWTKIAHETSGKSHAFGNLMRNMGKMAGVPDFIFTSKNITLWLELKDGKSKKLSPDQEFFKKWCEGTGSKWAIAYTLHQAITVLEDEGIVMGKK